MRFMILASIFMGTTSFVYADTILENVAIRVSKEYAGFSTCVADVSLAKVSNGTTKLDRLLYSAITGESGSRTMARLRFSAISSNGTSLGYQLMFKSLDDGRFQLIQGENGEIFPFTSKLESRALLVSQPSGSVIGMVDISSCK